MKNQRTEHNQQTSDQRRYTIRSSDGKLSWRLDFFLLRLLFPIRTRTCNLLGPASNWKPISKLIMNDLATESICCFPPAYIILYGTNRFTKPTDRAGRLFTFVSVLTAQPPFLSEWPSYFTYIISLYKVSFMIVICMTLYYYYVYYYF